MGIEMINELVQRIELDDLEGGGYKATIVYRHSKGAVGWLVTELLIRQTSLGIPGTPPTVSDAMYEVGHLLKLHLLGRGRNNLDFVMMREDTMESVPSHLRAFSKQVPGVEPEIKRPKGTTFWRAERYRN